MNPLQSLSGGTNSFQPGFGGNTSLDQDLGMGMNSNSAESQVKYTCRYDIQIPNEREF